MHAGQWLALAIPDVCTHTDQLPVAHAEATDC
jgi:hypothetical protein